MMVVVKMRHKGEAKMVGKIFKHGGVNIFLHEESGNQSHRNLDSPGGIDQEVIEYLRMMNVVEVHHYSRERGELYITDLDDLHDFGVNQLSDGRRRVYLPTHLWAKTSGKLPYKVPWIRDEVILG